MMNSADHRIKPPEDCEDCIDKIIGKKRRGKRKARKFHKWVGLVIALPLIWVLLTGIVLNQTVEWKLDQREINTPWIKNHYGMTPTGEPRGQKIAGTHVIEWDGIIFFNGKPLSTSLEGKLLGALSTGDEITVVTEYGALKLDSDGNTIEKLDELSLPELPLTAIAQKNQTCFLKNTSGWHTPDADWIEFSAPAEAPFGAITLVEIENQEIRSELESNWSRGGLPLSRIVLDLHSGRFFGTIGKYLYDLVAVCTILLTITGLMLFFRKPQKKRRKSRG